MFETILMIIVKVLFQVVKLLLLFYSWATCNFIRSHVRLTCVYRNQCSEHINIPTTDIIHIYSMETIWIKVTAIALYAIQREYTISPRDYRYHTGNDIFSIKWRIAWLNDYEHDLQQKKCNHSEGISFWVITCFVPWKPSEPKRLFPQTSIKKSVKFLCQI